MGFFDSRPVFVPPPEDEEEVQHPPDPEWFGPPETVVPGYVPDRAVLFRTEDVACVVGRFDCYRTGVELGLAVYVRGGYQRATTHHMPWEREQRPGVGPAELPDDLLRLGILLADGTSWSNLDPWPTYSRDEAPTPPFVMFRGGGGGGSRWGMRQWLWPLPPPGPLTFIAEWPKHGIPESRVSLDADKLRVAAEDAIELWG